MRGPPARWFPQDLLQQEKVISCRPAKELLSIEERRKAKRARTSLVLGRQMETVQR
jgi:hypothetical protein